ncbi:MAG: hypothetical protein ACK5WW_03815 [Brevundimonas sp.]|uniref:hypothetical protein n=1 Tax=Brevundimonas sp. TaxID=1871086 RepID=UPI0022C61FCA|nr:hypothetical protein [Brevundimonas sp.]MCZ8085877.1 hypothetical protein [Brevundimonas sp.]MCZ8194856.1 hypothetical protein [Brevundimonas sp.]
MTGRRLALFVHGIAWYGQNCPRGTRIPKGSTACWTGKTARDRARDAEAEVAIDAIERNRLSLAALQPVSDFGPV